MPQRRTVLNLSLVDHINSHINDESSSRESFFAIVISGYFKETVPGEPIAYLIRGSTIGARIRSVRPRALRAPAPATTQPRPRPRPLPELTYEEELVGRVNHK